MDSPTTEDGNPFGEIPTRPMRVKVLYTFDYENKTNCLARLPDTLHIPAVAIDDNAQVGVIELRQCIQAIVEASPELLSRLTDGDFTIYAYDFSEYETPLVGQGMLSSALSASAPIVPAHQSKTMITGRVCNNLPGVFSNGIKETLEVKLRLVPVPKQVQNEYVRTMESLRGQSPAMSGGFDPNAWNASLNPGNSQQTNNDYFQFDMGTPGSQHDQSLIDDIFGMGTGSGGGFSGQQVLGGVGMSQTPSASGVNPAFASHPHSAPGSRAGSPMMVPDSNTFNEQLRHQSFSSAPPNFGDQSRPGSRASVRSESYVPSHTHQRQLSGHSGDTTQQIENFYDEDGQPRKRAKVTQADWRGKSSFGGRSADLRVTAATAASMQMHRPVATRPCAPGSNLEPPPRVPTPTPHLGLPGHARPRIPSAMSMLRQASTTGSDFMSDVDQMSEAVMSSPEDITPENSVIAGETPQEFPSSPPLFPGLNEATPSSPGLPTLSAPAMADSGYMSERNFNSSAYPNNVETDDRSPDTESYATATQYQPRKKQRKTRIKSEVHEAAKMPPPYPSDAPTSELNFEWEQPGDMNQLPQKMLLNLPPGRGGERPSATKRASRTNSPAPRSMTPIRVANENAANARASSRAPSLAPAANLNARVTPMPGSMPPESRRGSLALPNKRSAPSDESLDTAPPAKKRQTSRRARSVLADSEAGSPAPSDTEGRPAGPNRSGSGAQRRKIIEQRMHDAVAKGEMPQYCVHCGAIETPTWRRLYFKVVEGKPGPLDSVEDEGETIAVSPLEWDDAGEVCKFIIRKSMKKAGKDAAGPGFEEVVICNPCGLWFKKNRDMRPKDKWGKKSGPRKSRKNRLGEIGIATDSVEPESESFFTDAMMPEEGPLDVVAGAVLLPQAIADVEFQQMPPGRPRSYSMQAQQRTEGTSDWNATRLDAALQRAIQSSPVRFQGSQDSPIEIKELTPKPTRRMLFPSPRKDGQVKSVDDKTSEKSVSPDESDKQAALLKLTSAAVGQNDVAIFEAFTFDKENMPPPFDDDDELAHLFDGSPSAIFKTPGKTPRKTPPKGSQHTIDQLLKTPTPASRKRRLLTPSVATAAANNVNQPSLAGNDFMTSPGSSRYFLRSTPTRLANTPGRRSGLGSDTSQQASPFSRHLSQLLNNATGGSGDCFTSPNGGMSGLDFGDLPTFNTPGRWEGLMNSDFGVFEDGQA